MIFSLVYCHLELFKPILIEIYLNPSHEDIFILLYYGILHERGKLSVPEWISLSTLK